MTEPTSNSRYDAVFAGFGASACILLTELHHTGILKGKRIAIVEPTEKNTNDRTFCFWAEPDSEIVQRFSPVISHSWEKVAFNGKVSSISPLQYHHIRGIDLYRYTQFILTTYSCDWYHEQINQINSEDGQAIISLSEKDISTSLCFDSRTPPTPEVEFPEVAIYQTFLGYKVKVRHAAPDSGYATLMDFDFEQDGFTQFIYRLPFAPDQLLVELTRFGEQKIDPKKTAPQLQDYIRMQYGEYEIIEEEYGCIPMVYSERKLTFSPGIIPLGTRAGKVKPSTGYAFKNMFDHARQICENLSTTSGGMKPVNSGRFSFYDQLLLIILLKWPAEGQGIFNRLLSGVPSKRVLTFLYEQTTIREEITIFSKLPVIIFLRALFLKEWHSFSKYRTEWLVLAGTLVAAGTGVMFPVVRDIMVWPVLVAGLVLIGIPHGAVDDMLQSDGSTRKIDLRFIFIYLLQGSVMICWWWLHAPSALLVFLLYSAWHFGQADLVESGIETSGTTGKLNMMVQGAGSLMVILLSHIPELNEILGELTVSAIPAAVAPVSFFVLAGLFLNAFFLRSRKLLIGYLTLALSIQLPLLMAFGVYFIFQHSLRGWRHLRTRFRKTDYELFRYALPFNIGAWLMLGVLYWFLSSWSVESPGFGPAGIFFVFLSGLSFPHVLAMDGFYRRN
ncbi:MAG: beta-carotene 15,15'-dioxygenase, Brp/Blh family [Cyclobacteriaceae bacterium]